MFLFGFTFFSFSVMKRQTLNAKRKTQNLNR